MIIYKLLMLWNFEFLKFTNFENLKFFEFEQFQKFDNFLKSYSIFFNFEVIFDFHIC